MLHCLSAIWPVRGISAPKTKKDMNCTITVTGEHNFSLETIPLKMLLQEKVRNSFWAVTEAVQEVKRDDVNPILFLPVLDPVPVLCMLKIINCTGLALQTRYQSVFLQVRHRQVCSAVLLGHCKKLLAPEVVHSWSWLPAEAPSFLQQTQHSHCYSPRKVILSTRHRCFWSHSLIDAPPEILLIRRGRKPP